MLFDLGGEEVGGDLRDYGLGHHSPYFINHKDQQHILLHRLDILLHKRDIKEMRKVENNLKQQPFYNKTLLDPALFLVILLHRRPFRALRVKNLDFRRRHAQKQRRQHLGPGLARAHNPTNLSRFAQSLHVKEAVLRSDDRFEVEKNDVDQKGEDQERERVGRCDEVPPDFLVERHHLFVDSGDLVQGFLPFEMLVEIGHFREVGHFLEGDFEGVLAPDPREVDEVGPDYHEDAVIVVESGHVAVYEVFLGVDGVEDGEKGREAQPVGVVLHELEVNEDIVPEVPANL